MTKPSRGLTGTLLKAFGANDYRLTVIARREVTARCLSLSFAADGLLADHPPHPTMWIRLWIPTRASKVHQRGFTVLRPDPARDRFDVEFAWHRGPSASWAATAQPGDTIAASVLGSSFTLPDPPPEGYLIVGDMASRPAINTLLSAIGNRPAQVWLESAHDDDHALPVTETGTSELTWVRRVDHGATLVAAVAAAARPMPRHFGFVACDTTTTRNVTALLRRDYHLDRKNIEARGYWMPQRPLAALV